jgi:PhoPQ-activated pathogenicity-related protein
MEGNGCRTLHLPPSQIAYMAMVKAAVRAMDTVQSYAHSALGLGPSTFIVAGASKRGWWVYAHPFPIVVPSTCMHG